MSEISINRRTTYRRPVFLIILVLLIGATYWGHTF